MKFGDAAIIIVHVCVVRAHEKKIAERSNVALQESQKYIKSGTAYHLHRVVGNSYG